MKLAENNYCRAQFEKWGKERKLSDGEFFPQNDVHDSPRVNTIKKWDDKRWIWN